MMKISYGITVHNEHEELEKLLSTLLVSIDDEDEVVICVDGNHEGVKEVVKLYSIDSRVIHYNRKLDGNFAEHKNSVIEKSSGDYIFHIDADEYPNKTLLQQIKQILEINQVDLIWIPRVNTVDGITDEHIRQWGWKLTEQGWVNYPDYQSRIFRNHESIRWKRPVHEQIQGCKTYAHLPPHEELSLYHPKTIQKQESQNQLYSDIVYGKDKNTQS
tara:strand:+ start:9997 stop:10644 length:648 start_codon:yes stop_codon:yes gene_type:complete